MKHFKLSAETKIDAFGVKLFRIEATVSGIWGEVGTIGGFIEKEGNIAEGNAWVYGNAWV